jgi:hypothetical protein
LKGVDLQALKWYLSHAEYNDFPIQLGSTRSVEQD